MIEQRHQPIAEQMGRRLEAGGKQQRGHGDQLVVAELLAGVGRRHEPAEQVFSWLLPAFGGEVGQILADGLGRRVGALQDLRREDVQHHGPITNQRLERQSVGRRDAEQFADHGDRQRERECVDEVGAALQAGKQFVDE